MDVYERTAADPTEWQHCTTCTTLGDHKRHMGTDAEQYARPGDPALAYVLVHPDGMVKRYYGTATN